MSALPHITYPEAWETNCIKKPNCATERKTHGAEEQIPIVYYGSFPWISGFGKKAELALLLLRGFVAEYLCQPWVLRTPCFPHLLDVVFLLLLLSSHHLTAELHLSQVPLELGQESFDNNIFGIIFQAAGFHPWHFYLYTIVFNLNNSLRHFFIIVS